MAQARACRPKKELVGPRKPEKFQDLQVVARKEELLFSS